MNYPTAATSKAMAANRHKDTKPEMVVRRLVHSMGYRYRLHRKDLPGKPDMVFPSRKKVIEVRGCFWHRHPGCKLAYMPKTRVGFWSRKFDANVARDAANVIALENQGWRVLIVWECDIRRGTVSIDELKSFLDGKDEGGTGKDDGGAQE